MHSTRLQSPNHMHSTREQTLKSTQKHCVCECPRRPENNGEVVVKSRSLSPRLKRSLRRKSGNGKPPFKTGKADESIISRRDFPPSPSTKRRAKMRNSLPSTPIPAEGDPRKFYRLATLRHKLYPGKGWKETVMEIQNKNL